MPEIIEFPDVNGAKQTLDLTAHGSFAFNVDCMEVMKKIPDKYFDLACIDPPYGGSQSVNEERERERELHGGAGEYHGAIVGRFGGRFAKYHLGIENGRELEQEVSDPRRGYL